MVILYKLLALPCCYVAILLLTAVCSVVRDHAWITIGILTWFQLVFFKRSYIKFGFKKFWVQPRKKTTDFKQFGHSENKNENIFMDCTDFIQRTYISNYCIKWYAIFLQGSSQGVHSIDSSYTGQQEDGVDVNIEIQSNWGHPNTLGITEVRSL